MKERPILFSAPMVRAILEGRKTITRRVIKPQPHDGVDTVEWRNDIITGMNTPDQKGWAMMRRGIIESEAIQCPYGQPGDRLRVRETWYHNGCCSCPVHYRATEPEYTGYEYRDRGWRPSIFMPRWASRILLEVIAVRVERVQDISPKDIMAEGIHAGTVNSKPQYTNRYWVENVTADFRSLWNEINAKRGCGWDANPWVWVIEFRRVEP